MKIKQSLGISLSLVATLAFLPTINQISSQAESINPADTYFLEFIDENVAENVVFESRPLYNVDLQVNGYEYTFEVDGQNGYALLAEMQISDQTVYEVEELFYNKPSPFSECTGMPVYVTFNLYLEYKNNQFYNLENDTVMEEHILQEAAYKGFGYGGTDYFVDNTQTVSYARKESTSYAIANDLPNYYGTMGETSCANTAGAVLIGYYDQFCENLIPNYKTYIKLGSTFRYKSATTEIDNLIIQLGNLMSGGTQQGVTFSQFQAGMNSYVSGKGYTYTTVSMLTNGVFNFNSYKNAVESGKPVALFLNGFGMIDGIVEGNNIDTIQTSITSYTHVAIGCGYKCDTYYDSSNNVITTRRYFKVASGLSDYNIGYVNMNVYGEINKAISVQIQ